MNCKNHSDREAEGACVYCGHLFCSECLTEINGRKYCREHASMAEKTEEISDFAKNYGKKKDFSDEFIGQNNVNTLKGMVGHDSYEYIDDFQQIEDWKNGKASACGLIWPYYMLYRKMYKEFFIFFAVNAVAGLLMLAMPGIGYLAKIGLTIYMIVCIKKIYYKSILRKLEKYKLTGVDIEKDKEAEAIVDKIGGTNLKVAIGYLVFVVVINIANIVSSVSRMYMF